MKSILVVGGAGYVGSGLLRDLLSDGHMVVCLDKLAFGGESLLGIWSHPKFHFYKGDIRDDDVVSDVLGRHDFDYVIHLAAIVGDPACKLYEAEARETNWDASVRLIEQCRRRGVPKFAFASTCSNYGKMSEAGGFVDEESRLAPVSLYAELKVRFEKYILEEMERSPNFNPTILRFSTVYGLSPRMRFDLTVNEFTKELVLGNELVVFGEQFWRPYCHVQDFSRAFRCVMIADDDKVAYKVFNVGDTGENYTKQMIIDELVKVIPEARVRYVQRDEDPRDYRVNSGKIKRELGFKISRTVPDGIREIVAALNHKIIENPQSQKYYNIPVTG